MSNAQCDLTRRWARHKLKDAFSKEEAMAEDRKIIDCRLMPSEQNCSLAISGRENEVLEIARHHAVTVHGHADTPELKEQLRGTLRDAPRGAAELY